MMNITEHIRDRYYTLTGAEQKVACYVMENAEAVQFMSISELAELSGVADATVTRFCRSLDLKGFYAFKIELAKGASSQADGETADISSIGALVAKEAKEAIDESVSRISEKELISAVKILENADRVMCCGVGGSMILASECAHTFSCISSKFTAVADSHMQALSVATMKPGDAVILFSYSGATKLGMDLIELTKTLGVKTVLVTKFARSPMAPHADAVLCCGSKEGPYQLGTVPARIAQLVTVDMLFREYKARNKEESEENIRRIASALSDKHI